MVFPFSGTNAGLCALLLLVVLVFWLVWQNGRGARNASRARRLGRSGEARAKRLLEAAGYRILQTQATKALTVLVDGEPTTTHLRADFLLERSGLLFVADAKSGTKAPSASHAATRRQLLEYATAYDVDGVLLVDASRGSIHQVAFPALRSKRRSDHGRSVVLVIVGGLMALAGYVAVTG